MIAKNQMMDLLLDVCPSFRPTWAAFLDYWKGPADELPLYLALAEFARHLIELLERSATQDFPVVFQAIERLQLEGEHYVQEAMVVGLLEDLQNRNLHSTTEPEHFRPFLRPESVKAWDELYKFWRDVATAKAAGLLKPRSEESLQIDVDAIQDPELRRLAQQLYRKE